MKFNFTVDIADYDEDYSFQEQILDKATKAFTQQILGSTWEKDSLSHQLEVKINQKVDMIMNKDFKDAVANKAIELLEERFEKSRQYKELVKGSEIETDHAMKTGLRDMVAEIVKSEMKKVFK